MVSPASACISVRACTYTLVDYSLICLLGSTVCALLAETKSRFPFLMLAQNWYCSSSKYTCEWIHKRMTKCKHKPVCGASDLLTRTRNGKKMVVIGWRPWAFIPFSSTRGKAPSTEESARHREEQHTPQREGAQNMGPYIFTELNQPLSDLLSGGFSKDALNLSRGGAEMWGKRNRVMNTALHTQSVLLSSSNGECVQAAGHVTPGSVPLQVMWCLGDFLCRVVERD